MKALHLLILIAVAVGCTTNLILLCNAEDIYYVKPTNPLDANDTSFDPDALCPGNPCYTFDYYQQNYSLSFTSNTWIHFLPGIHLLGPGESLIDFHNITNLTLAGSTTSRQSYNYTIPESIIFCQGETGFVFDQIEGLSIQHLTFFSCGGQSSPDLNIAFALGLFNLTNACLSHVAILDSMGYGLLGINVLGISSITDSTVLLGKDSEEYLGGNAVLYFTPSELDCIRLGNDTIQFSIKSSTFSYGQNTYNGSGAAGLWIATESSCSNSYINIFNSSFNENLNLYGVAGVNLDYKVSHQASSMGGNLEIVILEQENSSNYVNIDNCSFRNGISYAGGGINLIVIPSRTFNCFYKKVSINLISIRNSYFNSNVAKFSGGLHVGFSLWNQSCHQNDLQLRGVIFDDNKSIWSGGNAGINSSPYEGNYNLEITDCIFSNGSGMFGGGLLLNLQNNYFVQKNGMDRISITRTKFLDNHADYGGGGVAILATPIRSFVAGGQLGDIMMINCSFANNVATSFNAIYVFGFADVWEHTFSYNIICINLSVFENMPGHAKRCPRCDGKAIGLIYVQNATITNGSFYNNEVGAIKLLSSKLFLGGNISFHNNSGFNGAGIELCTNSYIFLNQNTYVSFTNNHARYAGGAMYVQESDCNRIGIREAKCFFNLNYHYNNLFPISSQMNFASNTAQYAGSALYGGNIDSCIQYKIKQENSNDDFLEIVEYVTAGGPLPHQTFNLSLASPDSADGSQLFDLIFKFHQSGLSVVSSDPTLICLCENGHPNCTLKQKHLSVYPGEVFTVSTVAVGQRDGVVPGVVVAHFAYNSSSHILDDFQISQEVGSMCTSLYYNIFSNESYEELILMAEKPDKVENAPGYSTPPSVLTVTLLPYPPGFTLRGPPPRFKCDCVNVVINFVTSCDIAHSTLHRPATALAWIGYYESTENATSQSSTSGILLHKHCPFDYCKSDDIDINLNYSDDQCAFSRSGILCGSCKPGLSLPLATSRCLSCSNAYLTLILVFILAGMILVFALTALNLTVSEGTISGLVFYANIVHVNKVIFFPTKIMDIFSIFTAWLNLDFGIEICLYDGMDMYARTWLQFVFPLYIWAIVMFMIVSSHYSTIAAKLFGRNNSVRVLATLLLLSYAKILRTIITALSFTTLTYPDKSIKFLWLADANIQYLTGKHVPLFLVALLFLLLSLPYTALLLFLQCLWPRSHYRLLSWMRRIKPFLDAHIGPYKDKYRFWPGLLFLVRIILFMAFAVNSLGDMSLNLLFTSMMIMCLLGFKWIASGIYKNWLLDILEASFFLNLGMLSVSSLYIRSIHSEKMIQNAVSGTSLSIVYATFIGILIYHFRNHVPQTIRKAQQCLLYCCTCAWRRHDMQTDNAELEELVAEDENGANVPNNAAGHNAVSGDSLAQPQPTVQCLRLTFDRNATSGEAILVEDAED